MEDRLPSVNPVVQSIPTASNVQSFTPSSGPPNQRLYIGAFIAGIILTAILSSVITAFIVGREKTPPKSAVDSQGLSVLPTKIMSPTVRPSVTPETVYVEDGWEQIPSSSPSPMLFSYPSDWGPVKKIDQHEDGVSETYFIFGKWNIYAGTISQSALNNQSTSDSIAHIFSGSTRENAQEHVVTFMSTSTQTVAAVCSEDQSMKKQLVAIKKFDNQLIPMVMFTIYLTDDEPCTDEQLRKESEPYREQITKMAFSATVR